MQRLLTWHNPLTRWTATALAVLLLAGAPAAPAAAAAIELIGTGAVPGTATDNLGATPATLEDGTPHNRVGGFGSAVAYTGSDNLYIATPDRGPADGITSYQDRYYLLDISVAPGTPTPVTALEVIVPFPSDPAIAVGAGDVITVSVRAGTTPTGAFCGGHASATGVRLYYDSAIRPARVGELHLHRASGGTFDSIAPPAGPPALKDSPATTLSGGNPWRLAGTWALTP
jgi:hypothetical protein